MKGIKLIMDTKIIEKINYLSDKIYGTKYNWHSKGNRIQWIDNNENLKDLTQDLWAIKNGIVNDALDSVVSCFAYSKELY